MKTDQFYNAERLSGSHVRQSDWEGTPRFGCIAKLGHDGPEGAIRDYLHEGHHCQLL